MNHILLYFLHPGDNGVILQSLRARFEYLHDLNKIFSFQVDLDLLGKLHKLQDVELGNLEASLVSRIAAKDAL